MHQVIVGPAEARVQRVLSYLHMSATHHSLERHHAQLLLALRDTGQLSLAAQALSITASAASHRLREAERRMGIALAVPRGRSLQLTPSGRHLADVAATSEAALRSGEETARWLDSTARPTVRLAMGFYDTTPWFAAFGGDTTMGFRIDVVRVRYGETSDAVIRRVADLGIELVAAAAPEGDLVTYDELAAVVPLGHPAIERGALSPDDVARATYLTAGSAPTNGFEHSEFLAPAGAMPGELVMIESVSLILRLVAAGRGISIQPRLTVDPALTGDVAVLPLLGSNIAVRWDAITRAGGETDPAAALAAIRSHLGDKTTTPQR